MANKKLSVCSIFCLGMLLLIGTQIPSLMNFIKTQNEYFDQVNVYTPDIDNLKMTELTQLYDSNNENVDILDSTTGKLKFSGWAARDENLFVNKNAVKANENKNWL